MKNRSKLIAQIVKDSSEFKVGNIAFTIDGDYVNITEPKHEGGNTFYSMSIIAMLSPIFSGYITIEDGIVTYKVY